VGERKNYEEEEKLSGRPGGERFFPTMDWGVLPGQSLFSFKTAQKGGRKMMEREESWTEEEKERSFAIIR